jgi:hypothetical protein
MVGGKAGAYLKMAERGMSEEDYVPKGDCRLGCGHPATRLWFPRRRVATGAIYAYVCECCYRRQLVERALDYIARLPELEEQFHAAQLTCGEKDEETAHKAK